MAFAAAGLTHSADHLAAGTLILLAVFGFAGGVGTTALGPGGVLVTIGLFLLSGLPPAAISGTAIAANVGSAVLGTGAFARSGQLRGRDTQRMALVLIVAAVVGTPLGVLVNAQVSGGAFGILLGVCVGAIGALLYLRERQRRGEPASASGTAAPHATPAARIVLPLGLTVAVVSGLFGLGGQLLSVPLLISLGAPMLPALGAAQAQSIVIAGVATVGYALRGAIAWPLVPVVGVPLLAGALAGWRVAHAVSTERLRSLLAVVLIAVGAYLIVHNA
ncbi:MAG: sulfite exporter TauE/SafE family protein [Solirubrobacteraceae bacterium]